MSQRHGMVIELGTRWIKGALLERVRGERVLRRVVCEPHAGETPDLIERVLALRTRLQAGGQPCVAHLPRQIVNIRLLNLPSVDPVEVADMVDLQVGRQIPYSRDEVHCESLVLGSDASGYTRVMLVVVQRAVVRHRFHVLEEAGCGVERMSISTEGLLRWYAAGPGAQAGDDVEALVDVDASHTELLVLRAGRLEFTRAVLLGADDLEADGGPLRLAREIARALDAYRAEPQAAPLRRVRLTGAHAALESVPSELAPLARCDVEVLHAADLFGAAVVAEVPPNLSITALAGADIGDDRAGVCIVPEALEIRRSLVARARAFTATGMLAATACFAACLAGFLHIAFLTRDAQALSSEAARLGEPAAEVQSMRERTRIVQERLDSRLSPVNVLRELHALLPDAVHLTSIEYVGPERLTLAGVTGSRPAIRDLVSKLEASLLFRDVKNPEVRAGRDRESGRERIDFQIVCGFRHAGREE